ncbi:MAG: NAD(P)-dependent oxidoreductase, partial [Acidimicrobiales bacterium]
MPDASLVDALGDVEGVDVIVWSMEGDPPRSDIDLVVAPYLGAAERLARLADVRSRLVQSLWLGYDGVAERLPPGVTYANAASVHETSTAELALALTLASLRGIPEFVRASAQGRWSQTMRPSLADRRVLLVGYGGVNRAVEDRLVPFEVIVTRVARS